MSEDEPCVKAVKPILGEFEHPSLKLIDKKKERELAETERATRQIIDEFKPLVESRARLAETEAELRGMMVSLTSKIDELSELKKSNIELEREVLTKIRSLL